MNKPFLDKLRKIDPYVPGEQPKTANVIKLNANENPYPPAPGVTEVLRTFDAAKLAVYPDANAKALKTALAEREGLKPSQVFLGNGSDDVLALAFQSFFCSDKPILYPDITYSFYPVWCDLFRIPYETLPLDEDFCVNVRDYDKPNGGIVLPNPNAPTGMALPLDVLRDLAAYTRGCGEVLLIDEAYAAFAEEVAVPLLREFDNVIITRTFSKSHALAGMRVGYALGHPRLMAAMKRIRDSFNSYPVDRLAQSAAREAELDTAYTARIVATISRDRDICRQALADADIPVLKSRTNFLFVKAAESDAAPIQQLLRDDGILVRHFSTPLLQSYLRVTIGTTEDMRIVTERLIRRIKG